MSPFLCFLSKLLLVLTTCKIINIKISDELIYKDYYKKLLESYRSFN